jgi:hypothetical protein
MSETTTAQPTEEELCAKYNVPRVARVGEHVIWHDPQGGAHDALVTAVWTPTCINVVVIDPNEGSNDSYGRQIERKTSQSHKNQQKVHGFYWRFADEEPNGYQPPMET